MAVGTARVSPPAPPAGPVANRRRARPARHKSDGAAGYVFLSPWLLGFAAITAIPKAPM